MNGPVIYSAQRNSFGRWLGIATDRDGDVLDCTRRVFASEDDAIDAIIDQYTRRTPACPRMVAAEGTHA